MGSFIPWIPTPPENIGPFFELAPVSSDDTVYDPGSRDGRLLFAALENGEASIALKPKFESELKPGARVVMESFPVPGWKPVETRSQDYKKFYLYTMPPQIEERGGPPGADYVYDDYGDYSF